MPEIVSVANGLLVPMRSGSNGTIIEVSLPDVGHKLASGAVIVDASGKPIPAKKIPIRKIPGSKVLYDHQVIDAGPQYRYAFDPKAPPQCAMVHKV